MNENDKKERVKTVIEGVLTHLSPGSPVSLVDEGGRFLCKIEPKNGVDLIGLNGETLRALTYVTRKILEKEFKKEELNGFLIDVGGYVEKRIASLKEVAFFLGKRAEDFKRDVEMEPMSSFERFIIHSFFENHASLRTESRGYGKTGHVVILYAPGAPSEDSSI